MFSFVLCSSNYTLNNMQLQFLERTKIVKKPTIVISNEARIGRINIDHFIAGKSVRFLFSSCEESLTNERLFERAGHGQPTGLRLDC